MSRMPLRALLRRLVRDTQSYRLSSQEPAVVLDIGWSELGFKMASTLTDHVHYLMQSYFASHWPKLYTDGYYPYTHARTRKL